MKAWAALLLAPLMVHAAPLPLDDPLPEKIAKGDIVVAAVPFVRAPRSSDPAKPATTNAAHARLQYLLPIPDGSGRLAFNDVRGLLYVTDATAARLRSIWICAFAMWTFTMRCSRTRPGYSALPPSRVRAKRQARLRQALHRLQRRPR